MPTKFNIRRHLPLRTSSVTQKPTKVHGLTLNHATGAYQYEPISQERREIRVLTLYPGGYEDNIRLHLDTVELSPEVLKYEALSYAWGSPDKTHAAAVVSRTARPGGQLAITESLDTALRCLRRKWRPRVLWIDAVSINQDDTAEKDHQVQKMHEVYKSADRVVIFLGPASPSDLHAMDILEAVGESTDVSGTYYWPEIKFVGRSMAGSRRLEAVLRKIIARKPPPPLVLDGDSVQKLCMPPSRAQAVVALLQRPWFSRVWVIQEVHSMRDPSKGIVQCGNRAISWDALRSAALCFHHLDHTEEESHIIVASIRDQLFNMMELLFDSEREVDLFDQHLLHGFHCSDLRDRIYGILSLAEESMPYRITVNYALSVEDIFEELQRQEIRTRGLWMLQHAHMDPDRKWRAPSWVPNQLAFPDYVRQMDFTPNMRFAPNEEFVGDRGLLVYGRRVAVVQRTLDEYPMGQERWSWFTLEWLRRVGTDLAKDRIPESDGESVVATRLLQLVDLCGDFYKGATLPIVEGIERSVAKAALHSLFPPPDSTGEQPDDDALLADPELKYFLIHVHPFLARLPAAPKPPTIFTTDTNDVGLGPACARPGDVVCSILGSRTDMLLRPTAAQGEYVVVGATAVAGNIRSEAVLGPLPGRVYFARDLVTNVYTFRDARSGELVHDPRLERCGLGHLAGGLDNTRARTGDIKLRVDEMRDLLGVEAFVLV